MDGPSTAPVSTPTASPSPAASPGASAPSPAGATPAPQTGAGRHSAPGGQSTQAEVERYVFQRLREGADPEDIDISGWKGKVKVNGQEREVSLPDLMSDYRTKAASFAKFEEAAALRKQVQAERARLERAAQALNDPERVMDHLRSLLGDKFDAMIEQRLVERVKRERLPADVRQRVEAMEARERELRAKEQTYEQREAEIKRRETERRQEAARAQAERWRGEWPQQLVSMGLPNNPQAVERAVEMTRAELQRMSRAGVPIDAVAIRDAQRATVDFFRSLVGDVVKGSPPDALRSLAGDEAVSAIAKAHAAAIDAQPGRAAPPQEPGTGRFRPRGPGRVDLMDLARGITSR